MESEDLRRRSFLAATGRVLLFGQDTRLMRLDRASISTWRNEVAGFYKTGVTSVWRKPSFLNSSGISRALASA